MPQNPPDRERLNAISRTIIGRAYQVSNTLGNGYLEKVYENALAYELSTQGLKVAQQHPLTVRYANIIVGEYIADLIIEDCVLVELKASKTLDDAHLAQCLNYLKTTGLRLCLLLNFGQPKVEIQRIVHKF